MWGKILTIIPIILFVLNLLIPPTFGKEFPAKPIEIVCNMSPGSIADLTCRLIADLSQKYLGSPVIVFNKVGAGGSIAAADVINSKPDGYKLVYLYNTFFVSTVKIQKVPFDPNDLVPIADFVMIRTFLAVKGDSPWKNLNDLLDFGKKNPGKLRWSTTGRGITTHIDALLLFRKAGIETVHMPYPGTPEMLAALLGGHIEAANMSYEIGKDYIRAGKVRALTFFMDRRHKDEPNVPCVVELGFPESARLPGSGGLYAHKDTPKDIQKTLFETFKKVYEDPEFKKGCDKLGNEIRFGDAEFVKRKINEGIEVAVPILKELGLFKGE